MSTHLFKIPLTEQSVVAHASRPLCFEVVASAGKVVEQRSANEKVVEYVTNVGGREIRTVELLELFPPERIEYTWLEGPLPKVEEEIGFAEGDDETVISYRGAFWTTGLRGWLTATLRVRSTFEDQVRQHLLQAKEISEARAARTRIHRRPGAGSAQDPVKIYDEDFGPTGLRRPPEE